jgi:heptosyltransferase-2
MLFNFRKNYFDYPFKGIRSFLAPIEKFLNATLKNEKNESLWNFPLQVHSKLQEIPHLKQSVVFVPSAAWEMKRWPLNHWKSLASLIDKNIIILGGKEDASFCEEIKEIAPQRIQNLAGKLSLIESCAVVQQAHLIISADTGLLHVADVFGKKALSLMGPTAFGFTTHANIKTLEIDLSCRPCTKDGRGNCHQATYQKCMVDITPSLVAHEARHALRE